jgi:hypothetical protein
MEYYSAIKKNEIMIFARKWMELKIIRLSEIRVILKKVNTTCFLLFMESRSKKKKKKDMNINGLLLGAGNH